MTNICPLLTVNLNAFMRTSSNFSALRRVAALIVASSVANFAAAAPVEFNRDIRPILSDKCFGCHGPDSGHRKSGLRLDSREAALAPAKSGDVAIVPGNPEKSHLLLRIFSSDSDEVMPPPEAKMEALSAREKDLVRRWILEGAKYEPLWSFLSVQPVALPPAPAGVPPELLRTPLDRLLFARLELRNLRPRPEARPETLLRRVSLDLTGLPPTAAEVRAFMADSAPGAYERAVDRLLASPAFGERLAVDWLDVARYSDSFGFQVDRDRDAWPWRDWVVRAFNRNLPFNEFVTWQIAGDLLPNATEEQVLATAFNRLHQQETEGGSVEEEYRVEYVSDRVQTFATAFLGLTFECAKCHDHKFDPITQREFYQMFAFFDDIDEAGLYSFFTGDAPTPAVRLIPAEGQKQAAALQASVVAAEARVLEGAKAFLAGFPEWLGKRPAELPLCGELVRLNFSGAKGGKVPNTAEPAKPASVAGENKLVPGRSGQVLKLSGDDAFNLPAGSFNRPDPFTVSLWMQAPDLRERAVVLHRSKAWMDAASRGFELLLENGLFKWSLIRFWPGDAASVRTRTPIKPGEWLHVSVSSDGSGRAAGLQIHVNGKRAQTEVLKDNLSRDTNPGRDNITIGERMRDRGFKGGLVDDVRIFNRRLSDLELQAVFNPDAVAALWQKPVESLSPQELEELQGVYLAQNEGHAKALEALRCARAEQLKFLESQREIMVMRDLPKPKKAFVLTRGEYARRGEEVYAGTPAALPVFPSDAPRNRLGLARWLTAPEHPLLARVTVNRFWQGLFGRGLVRSAEDFGSQGTQPEYPELLDWLAGEFIRSGWDLKALFKSIVLSHAYRQESVAPADLLADDPENALLARGPRFRLPAEALRDTLLFASGLLSPRIGGAPVAPYELAEAFRPVTPDKGEGSLRRSLYTRWRRTAPPPAMMAFDASRRAVCSARRERTNTPLQALVLLNGPQYVEAARVLGTRLHKTHEGRLEGMIEEAFLVCLSRFPDAREREIVSGLYADQLAYFRAHPNEAALLLKVGYSPPDPTVGVPEAAAATVLAQALFNHDGSVVKQ
jgi:hypothetical protein